MLFWKNTKKSRKLNSFDDEQLDCKLRELSSLYTFTMD